jgi:NADH:ubiquinone oxidoreductase subunit E
MQWNLEETIHWYRRQGAPGDQNAVIQLLREIQQACGGISQAQLAQIAESYGVKEGFLLAFIRRIPGLRLSETHVLELCAGPNCPKRAPLAEFVEKTYGKQPAGFTVKQVPCMRMCGKGPNIRWDGKVYNQADEKLLRSLIEGSK